MKTRSSIKAAAPGKLILSGEHAVVYGYPALVMAVDRYVTTTMLPQEKPEITFYFPALMAEQSIDFFSLMQLKDRVRQRYQNFLKGNVSIRDVLQKPVELVQFALSVLLEAMNIQSLEEGLQVHMQTDILPGCGMGSSAAAIVSVLSALVHYLGLTIAPEVFFELAHEAETMQHGKSSGLDLKCSLHGGCFYFKERQMIARTLTALPLYFINTGQPQTSTGECIAKARLHFDSTHMGDDFAAATDTLDSALQLNKTEDAILAIRENHRLLSKIGVVPLKVQQLIRDIEKKGGAAKISGAGASAGDNAGSVLIVIEDEAALKKIMDHYQQTLIPIQCEPRGIYVH